MTFSAVADPRHTIRVLVFQCLCVLDAQGDDGLEMLGGFLVEHAVDADSARAAEARARAAWALRRRLDERIGAAADRWALERMTPVDRSILRVGVYELTEGRDVPPAVAINEAVEIAREYGGENSPGFVNGVLDAVRKAYEGDEGECGEGIEGPGD